MLADASARLVTAQHVEVGALERSDGRNLTRQDFFVSPGAGRCLHQRMLRPDSHDPQQALASRSPKAAQMTSQGVQTLGLVVALLVPGGLFLWSYERKASSYRRCDLKDRAIRLAAESAQIFTDPYGRRSSRDEEGEKPETRPEEHSATDN